MYIDTSSWFEVLNCLRDTALFILGAITSSLLLLLLCHIGFFLCIKFADNRYQGTHEWFFKKNYLLGGLEQANQHYDKFIPKCQETTFTVEFLALEQKSCYCQQRKMEVFWSETAKHCRGPMFYVCCKYLHIMSSIKILVQSLILSFFHPIDPLVEIAYTPLVHILRLLL